MKRYLIVYKNGDRHVYEGEDILDVLERHFSSEKRKQIVEVIELPY